MTIVSSARRLLRSVIFMTLFAVLTVLLIVPTLFLTAGALALLLVVLAVALPFAVIAFVLWCPFFAFSRDRRAAWTRLRLRARNFGRWLVAVPIAGCVRMGTWGIRVGRTLVPKALPVVRRAGTAPYPDRPAAAMAQRPPARPRIRGSVAWEMIAGASVATIIICQFDSTGPGMWLGLHLIGGAIGGAILGRLVGKARLSLRPESS